MQKFSELPYTRPDIAAAVEEYKRYSEAFKAAKTFEEAKKVFLDAEKLDTHLSTIASLCSIRNTMNTTDEFYEAEMAYLNENLPNLIPAEKAMKDAKLTMENVFIGGCPALVAERVLKNNNMVVKEGEVYFA